MLARLAIASLIAAGMLAASGPQGHAFWKRSHWDACNDAPSKAERIRLQCWIFYPVGEFPPGLTGAESWHEAPPYGVPRLKSRSGGPVVRRLG